MAQEINSPTEAEFDHATVELRELVNARIHSGKMELPVLPEAASQVVTLSYDENCDISQLTGIIKRDQSLSGNVLRISNSPIYNTGMQIKSLDHAVSRLGMKKVREIALIISCESRVFAIKGFEAEVRVLFQHSLAAAGFAEEIARIKRWNVEECFLCGLLHDIGRPVLFQVVADIEKERSCTFARLAVKAISDEIHAGLGGQMVKAWALPERLSESISYHHNPLAAPTASQHAQLTRLSSDLAHMLVGPKEFSESDIREHPMLAPLNLYEEEVDKIMAAREKVAVLVEAIT